MAAPEISDEETATKPRQGLATASVSIGSVGLVLALSTWAAWLTVLPRMQGVPYGWLTVVFLLVLGALWFACLPIGVLAIVFGMVSGATRPGGPRAATTGAFAGALAVVVALAGAAIFVLDSSAWPDTAFFMNSRGPL